MQVRGHGAKRAGDTACFARLLALVEPRLAAFDAFGLCIVVRTAARLGASLTGAQLRAWSEAAERRMAGCALRQLRASWRHAIACCCTFLGCPRPRAYQLLPTSCILPDFCALSPSLASRFNTQDLSNSIYSTGLLGLQLPPPARRAFMAAVCQRCGAMNPQELANTLLGLAYQYRRRHRQEPPPPGVEAAAVELLRVAAKRLHSMKHQELANTAWAFSKVGNRGRAAAATTSLLPQPAGGCTGAARRPGARR